MGECKFKGRPLSYADYLDTAAKLMSQQEKADFYYYLFSESGFDEKLTEAAIQNDRLRLVPLEDLFLM